MVVRSYRFDAAAARQYLALSRELYRDDRRWIPPLERGVLAQFSPAFPFYGRAGHAHRHFLATAGDKPVGHVSAFVNADLADADGTPVGAIGFFDCIDDDALAAELLATARAWLRSEHGRQRIWAPLQFDIWRGYRLMTRGFDTEIFFGEPYNKARYADHFERGGFRSKKRWYSPEVSDRAALAAMAARWSKELAQTRADGYRIGPIDVRADVTALQRVVDDAYRGFLGFAPLPAAEFAAVFATYAAALDARFALGAWRPDGALAGFAIAYPDQAHAVRAMRGSDSLLAKLRFRLHARRVRRAVFFMIGITAQEAQRGRGLGRALFAECLQRLLAAGYESVVFALLAEDSPGWKLLDAGPEQAQKTYALYEADDAR